ncbi:MAG: outer membrane beta-barrel protein [Pseudomonadota bacterium]
MSLIKMTAFVAAGSIFGLTASADGWYASGSIGINVQSDSDNSGSTGTFTTGNLGDGSTLDVAAGTDYGWKTEFDSGLALSAEVGKQVLGNWRFAGELAYTGSDVDTHTGVTLGGGSIDDVDAAALAGSPDPLDVTVGALVSAGEGEIENLSLFANVYYDFDTGTAFTPYVGGGLGFSDVDVVYAPSGVGIIDDGETKFAYQLKAGASFAVSETLDVFGEYAYRATDDIEVDNDLFPGTLDIENQQNIFSVGARFKFAS